MASYFLLLSLRGLQAINLMKEEEMAIKEVFFFNNRFLIFFNKFLINLLLCPEGMRRLEIYLITLKNSEIISFSFIILFFFHFLKKSSLVLFLIFLFIKYSLAFFFLSFMLARENICKRKERYKTIRFQENANRKIRDYKINEFLKFLKLLHKDS